MKLMHPSACCRLVALLAGAAVLGLSGCTSTLSGVGGAATYACQAPVGAQCTSVSGVYANAGQGARQLLGSQPPRPVASGALGQLGAAPTPSAITAPTPSPAVAPAALRTAPRILRLWIAPWEDSDGDLHEASTVNVLIDHGRWLIERIRPAPRGPRMGVTPPTTVSTAPTNTPPAGQTQAITPTTNPSLDQAEP
jgi:conjugal transfer pilus assembly protein TraV